MRRRLGALVKALLTADSSIIDHSSVSLFNQYTTADPAFDVPDAAERRLGNLTHYLETFAEARYLLVGEAAGFRACRFSGVPFTDETQLVGPRALAWAGEGNGYRRTS